MSNSPDAAPGRVRDEQNLNELRFSRTQSYFDRSPVIRLLIGLVFAIFLFLFLHFRETYVEILEVGGQAKRYVVAQVDFAYPDEEATIINKQEAAREIGIIYRLKEDQIHQKITEFQNHIASSPDWDALVKESGVSNLAKSLSVLSEALAESRFTDIRTLHKMQSLSIPTPSFFLYLPPHKDAAVKLPAQFWNALGKTVFREQEVPAPIAKYILTYFSKVPFSFEVDQTSDYTVRKRVQAGVPLHFTRVRGGERIIDQGEKVTSRHLAMMQAMKEKLSEKRNLWDPLTVAGSLLMTVLFLSMAGFYIRRSHPDIFYSNRKIALLATVVLLTILLAKVTELLLLKNSTNLIDLVRFPLFAPFAALLIGSLINLRIAAFTTVFLSIIFAMVLAVETTAFLVINLMTAMVAIVGTHTIRRRKEVFIVCGKAWLVSLLVVLAFNLYANTASSVLLLTDVTSTFIFMSLTAVLVVGLLPMLESLFHIMTEITLMEFMDPSNEFLRRLTVEAPGTYQHSIVVGNLAESAASAIGANGLFCRVATHYHDIGKLINPQYFTENQLGGVDLHKLLTPIESSQVIIAHVSEGVALARKVGLPEQFIDVIKEHHGNTLVYYFYHKQLELMGGDKSRVNERDFRYSGPKPRSKESTIIMIADCLEAASRSLDVTNQETITFLVDSLIAQKAEDGQFDESLLTFEELAIVKRAMIKTLLAATHLRIKYPAHHHPGEEG